jgi:hypothetical protein
MCTNICCFSIQGEDNNGTRKYIYQDEIIHNGQFRMLIVKFIPFQHRHDPIVTESIQCESIISFKLADERGIIFKSITMNGSLKIRTLKKKILNINLAKKENG